MEVLPKRKTNMIGSDLHAKSVLGIPLEDGANPGRVTRTETTHWAFDSLQGRFSRRCQWLGRENWLVPT
jgi:hypothetical protein